MDSRLFISCQNLGYYSRPDSGENCTQKWDIRDLTLKFYSGDKVLFRFNNNEQKEVLLRLFLKKLKPKTGSIIYPSKIHIYSDSDFWDGTDKKLSLNENIKSKLFSNRPWFGGKRKNLENLIDRLDLGGQTKNTPLNQLTLDQKIRLKTLMLVAAKTKVIILEKLFFELDEICFLLLQEWLDNFSGIIILFDLIQSKNEGNRNNKNIKQDKVRSIFHKFILFSSDGTPNFMRFKN